MLRRRKTKGVLMGRIVQVTRDQVDDQIETKVQKSMYIQLSSQPGMTHAMVRREVQASLR